MYFKDGSHLVDPRGDMSATLLNCNGWYDCPLDQEGCPAGPIVGYTANHPINDGTKWVGLQYANFSMADQWPAVLDVFAKEMWGRLKRENRVPDIIVGAPWAGVKFSQEVARLLGCRHIFAEKQGDDLILGRYDGVVEAGMVVAVGEELVNNTSTTGKLLRLIEAQGGQVTSVFCAINRSSPFRARYTYLRPEGNKEIPILGVIEQEMPQYHQSDPHVRGAIEKYGLVRKPKYEWPKLHRAMLDHRE